jgi:YVTN family beta-propeller protein
VRRLWTTTGVAAGLVVTLTGAAAATGLLETGPRGDGTAVTPVGFLVTPTDRQTTLGGLPLGPAMSPDGKRAYASAGGNNKIRVYSVDGKGALAEQAALPLPVANPAGQKVNMFPAGLAVAPDGRTVYVADQLADALSAVDVTTGAVRTVPVGHNPLGVALAADGRRAYVTNQGAASVSVARPTSTSVQ